MFSGKLLVAILLISFLSLFQVTEAIEGKCQNPFDIIILLDGSRSVRPHNFVLMKAYIRNFTKLFQRFGQDATQISVIQFASTVQEEFGLAEYTNHQDLDSAINDIEYLAGGTMTGEALRYLNNVELTPDHGSRLGMPGVKTITIILTDGKSQDYSRGTVTEFQELAKSRGVKIYAIGIGRKVNEEELIELASDPKDKHKFLVQDFTDLNKANFVFADSHFCERDVDECEGNDEICDHICINTVGSYKCDCYDGFELQEDFKTCLEDMRGYDTGFGFDQPLGEPSNLRIENVTHTTCKLSWEISEYEVSRESIDKFEITYSDAYGEKTKLVPGNVTTTYLVDLVPSVTYNVSVRAVQTDETSPKYSSPVYGNFTTLALGSTTVTLSHPTLTTLTANWTPAGGDGLTGYELICQRVVARDEIEVTSPEAVTYKFGIDVLSKILEDLDPGTVYAVRVIPMHGDLVGENGIDRKKTGSLKAPKVTVRDTSLATLSTRWKEINYPVVGWEVTVFTKGKDEMHIETVTGDQLDLVVDELNPSTLYFVEVVGNVTEGGRYFKTPAGKSSKKTKLLKKPKVKITDPTASSLVVAWKEINMPAASWSVKLFPKGHSKSLQMAEVNGDELSVQFDDLLPSAMYKTEVQAHVIEGEKTFDSLTGKQKGRTAPLTAPPVRVTDTTHSSLTFVWEDINRPVDEWTVKLYDEDGVELRQTGISGNENEINFEQLQPVTTYNVEVVGSVGENKSPPGTTSGTTKALIRPVITCRQTSAAPLAVEWSFEGDVGFWMVTIYPQAREDLERKSELQGKEREISLWNLLPSTDYVITLAGFISEGDKIIEIPEVETICTTESLIAPDVKIEFTTVSTLKATWEKINMDVAYWTVSICQENEENCLQTKEVNGDVKEELVVDGLDPSTTYNVKVVGLVTIDGVTVMSSPGKAEGITKNLVPVPSDLQFSDITHTTCNVQWDIENISDSLDYEYVLIYTKTIESNKSIPLTIIGDKSVVLRDLEPFTTYNVSVGVITEDGDISQPVEGLFTTKMLGEVSLTLTNPTLSTLTAEWTLERGDDVIGYDVIYNEEGGEESSEMRQNCEPNIRELILPELEPGTLYTARVIPLHDELVGTAGSDEERTASLLDPIVFCNDTTLSSITVNWENADDKLNFCDAEVYSEDRKIVSMKAKSLYNETAIVFETLLPSTSYNVKVFCTALEGSQMFTTPVSQETCNTDELTKPPVILVDITDDSLTVNWDDINMPVSTWTVNIYPKDSDVVLKSYTVDGDEHEKKFEKLDPDTPYVVKVIGNVQEQNMSVSSPPGMTQGSTNIPTPKPSNLRFSKISHTTARVQWDIGDVSDDVVDYYMLIYRRQDGEGEEIPLEVFDNKTEILVNLEPGTTYIVSVRAVNDYDISEKVEGDFTTKSLGSTILMLVSPTLTTLTAQWSLASGDNVTGYAIEYGKVAEEINGDGLSEHIPFIQETEPQIRELILRDLEPGTLYSASVTPLHGDLAGDAGSDEERTDALTAPIVTVIGSSLSTLEVNWTSANYLADTWAIEIFSDEPDYYSDEIFSDENLDYTFNEINATDKQHIETVELSGENLGNLFKRLKPSTKYDIEVYGRVVEGERHFVTPKGKASGETESLDVPEVTCLNPTESSVMVVWSAINKEVVSWTVTMYPEERKDQVQTFTHPNDMERELMINQLTPSTTFIVEVAGNVEEYDSIFSSPKGDDSCTTGPTPPRNIEVVERGLTDLVVNFDPPFSNFDDYIGECVPLEGLPEDTKAGTFTSENTMRCDDLEPATKYRISLVSVYRGHESEPLACLNVTLTPPPSGLTLLDPTTHTMVAEWQAPEEVEVDHYIVTYMSPFVDGEVRIVEGNLTMLLLTDLEPDTEYTVQVQAEINGEKSNPDVAEETTLEETITLEIDEVGYTTINVSWNPSVVPSLQSYCLEYSPTNGDQDSEAKLCLPKDLTKFSIGNLDTAQEYLFSISAKYSRSDSEESEKFATTFALPPIGPLTFTNVTESSFVAHWIPPMTRQPATYVVTYFADDMIPVKVENVHEPMLKLEGLNSSTLYNVTVSASYPGDLVSHPIKGHETTLDSEGVTCSCSTYLQRQTRMESMLSQMMQQIKDLTEKFTVILLDRVDELTKSGKRNARSTRRKYKRHVA